MNTGAVIVAAGMSTRMKQFKQMMKTGSMTLAERVVVNFQRAGINDIVIVTGFRGEEVEKALRGYGITFLKNDAYETTEMFDSAKIGFDYLKGRCDRILFTPADVPFFTEETVSMLLKAQGELVCPSLRGVTGHPILISASLLSGILSYQGYGGLKGALEHSGVKAVEVPVDDAGIVMDADTKEDYERLVNLHNTRLMRAQIQVRLVNQKPFFGPGTVTLLRQIDRMESVRDACEKAGISYSKGWTILRAAEEALGYRIVERQSGGKNGGMAYVTENGKKLLKLFEAYEKEMKQMADEKFKQFFLESDLF